MKAINSKSFLLPVVLLAVLATVSSALAAGDGNRVKEYERTARKGDYQAQRNLAYTLATSREVGVANPILGCAWYKLVLLSGSSKVGDGDIGNVRVYCGPLSREQQGVAEQQAQRLYHEIYLK
ncbi:hypothetical protein [Humidesulfovibrio idahonensis]